eukprot:515639-Pelagomonas_calceolata.AAC.2
MNGCNQTGALVQKDLAMTCSRMLIWYYSIPTLQKGVACTPTLRLPAHSICAQWVYMGLH